MHSCIWVAVSIFSTAMAQLQGTCRGNRNPGAGGQAGFLDAEWDNSQVFSLIMFLSQGGENWY